MEEELFYNMLTSVDCTVFKDPAIDFNKYTAVDTDFMSKSEEEYIFT